MHVWHATLLAGLGDCISPLSPSAPATGRDAGSLGMVQEASEDSSRSPEDTTSQEEYDSQETDEPPSPGACPSPGAFQASQCTSEYANIDAVRPLGFHALRCLLRALSCLFCLPASCPLLGVWWTAGKHRLLIIDSPSQAAVLPMPASGMQANKPSCECRCSVHCPVLTSSGGAT